MRATDWSSTPLGPMARWPVSLRTAVDLCLHSRFPMFVWWGPDLINIYNDAYAPMLGKRHPDAFGRPAAQVWDDIWTVIWPQVVAVMERGEATWNDRVPLSMVRNGYPEVAWFTFSYSPIRDEAGRVGGLFCAVTEETERVMSEASDALLVTVDDAIRSLTDPAEIAGTCARLLGEHLDVDRCAYLEVDPSGDDFRLTGDFNRGVPDGGPLFAFTEFGKEISRLVRGNQAFVVDDIRSFAHAPSDLSRYEQMQICAAVCVPLHKNGSLVAGMGASLRTPRRWHPREVELIRSVAARCWESMERAEAERALRESEERLRLGLEAGNIGTWDWDITRNRVEWSDKIYEFHGLKPGEYDGSVEGFTRLIHPEDEPRVKQMLTDALENGQPYELEFRTIRADGAVRWLTTSGKVWYDTSGRPIRMMGATADTTDRKADITSLNDARRELEEANRSKDRFLAVLSHELRTPLTPVSMALAAMSADESLAPPLRADIEMMRRNIELETTLIDDLLDLSRIVTGKMRLAQQPTHVHSLVGLVLSMVSAEYHDKRLVVTSDLSAANDLVEADPARLQQVLWNLVKNAAKFTPDGGRITISTRNEGQEICLDVSDSGKGISPEAIGKIFDAFEQGDAGVTRSFGGLGLGLAIAKAVVDQHGGTITAQSAGVGQGASFGIRLPTQIAVRPVPTKSVKIPSSRADRKLRILVAEDHEDTATILGRLLRIFGYDIRVAHSVDHALKLAEAERFDLLLSDIGLPDATGYDLMQEVGRRFGLKGIAMTGWGRDDDIQRGREAGFAEHIVKPVNLDQLHAAIRRVSGT